MAELKETNRKPSIQRRLLHVHKPVLRSRTHTLSKLNIQLMLDAFIPPDRIKWELT